MNSSHLFAFIFIKFRIIAVIESFEHLKHFYYCFCSLFVGCELHNYDKMGEKDHFKCSIIWYEMKLDRNILSVCESCIRFVLLFISIQMFVRMMNFSHEPKVNTQMIGYRSNRPSLMCSRNSWSWPERKQRDELYLKTVLKALGWISTDFSFKNSHTRT